MAAAIAARRVSVEDIVAACLDHIAGREGAVGAWEFFDRHAALGQARAHDRLPDGPARAGLLFGIPVGIKDIIDTADMPTGYGSAIYRGHRPAHDAACVARLRAVGAIILGKTVSTEFAYFTPGKTKNPHNPHYTPGGSSSGSAAAVADFMVPLALGTQTAGSVIRPAAFCGAVGYKASFGAFDMAGIKPFAPSLDTLGFFARTVADAMLIRAAMLGRPLASARSGVPRIGFCRTPIWAEAEPATHDMLGALRERLGAAGAAVTDIDLPASWSELNAAQQAIMAVEAVGSFSVERREHGEKLSQALRDLLAIGNTIQPAAEQAARALAAQCREKMAALFANCDVLLTPSAKGEAPATLEATGDPAFNRMWTLLGLPCVTLPAGRGALGLPLGAQLVGRLSGDDDLLAAAAWVEKRIS
ncbi:MAG: amidase [Rhodospirillales bacterium]|nr:amidase [Rhodospirillales bacterium]